MEKVKNAVIGLLKAMRRKADADTAADIDELINTIDHFSPTSKVA